MMIRSIIRYVLTAPVSVFLTILTIVLSPFLSAYSVIAGVTNLPGFLYLFQTYDDDLDGEQHQNSQPPPKTKLMLWWLRTCWLCRNPAMGFNRIMGVPIVGSTIISVKNTGNPNAPSYFSYSKIVHNGHQYFEVVIHKPVPFGFLRIWLGWKIKSPMIGGRYILKVDFSFRRSTT